ncbi:MAG: hypothetical protein WCI74_00765 [Actinomycetes bacterium]
MIRAIAFAPQPPIIVGATAGSAVHELDDLRSFCSAAITLAAEGCADLVVVGSRSGIDVGRWLVNQTTVDLPMRELEVSPESSAQQCRELGRQLAEQATSPTALLVMGDGSACRSERSPGYLDDRAIGFDQRIAAALSTADREALANVDPQLAQELLVAGRAPWQVVASAASASTTADWSGHLMTSQDPYGVSYFVALWRADS